MRCRVFLLLVVLLGGAGAARATDVPRVNLDANDRPVAEVVAALQEQVPEVQLALMQGASSQITVSVHDVPLQDAVAAVARALKGSFLRGYLVERIGPGDQPYSAEELLEYIRSARAEWQRRLTPEQRQAWQERVEAHFTALLQTGQGMPAADVFTHDDPLLRFAMMPTSERISLQIEAQPLQTALDLFSLESGYTVLVEEGVDGIVTLEAQEQELPVILDALAQAAEAHWRAFYLISEPVKLSPEDAERRADALFNQAWQGFWSNPPEQRARYIEHALRMLNSIPPEQIQAMKSHPMASDMFGRLMQAMLQLPQDQRREFAPVMQALGRIMAQ